MPGDYIIVFIFDIHEYIQGTEDLPVSENRAIVQCLTGVKNGGRNEGKRNMLCTVCSDAVGWKSWVIYIRRQIGWRRFITFIRIIRIDHRSRSAAICISTAATATAAGGISTRITSRSS